MTEREVRCPSCREGSFLIWEFRTSRHCPGCDATWTFNAGLRGAGECRIVTRSMGIAPQVQCEVHPGWRFPSAGGAMAWRFDVACRAVELHLLDAVCSYRPSRVNPGEWVDQHGFILGGPV